MTTIRLPALAVLAAAPALAQCPVQLADLTADAATPDAELGAAVALDADTALLGAPSDSIAENDQGSVQVHAFDGNAWTLAQTLTADDPGPFDRFGFAVDLEDDLAVVGAPFKSDNLALAGAAYVFRRQNGTWVQEQKLTAADADTGDRFGTAVAIDNGAILVGAPRNDNERGQDAGALYAFTHDGDQWIQQQKLLADTPEPAALFGKAVDAAGAEAIVGAAAPGDTAYAVVLERTADAWAQTDALPHDGSVLDRAVGIDADDAIVATQFEVVIWTRTDGTWNRNLELDAPGLTLSVAIGGGVAVVGEQEADLYATNRGKASVYAMTADKWALQHDLVPYADLPAGQRIGAAADADAGRVLLGAKGGDDVPGAAFLFDEAPAPCPTFNVPADYPDIASAIAHAVDGVTVEIADGMYTGPANVNLDPSGRNITVRSANGPDDCVIDAQNQARPLLFNSRPHAPGAVPVFEGLTIRNGFVPGNGGGATVLPGPDAPILINCRFEDCAATNRGGAVDVRQGAASLIECTITGASAANRGGALHVKDGGLLTMLDTTIDAASATVVGGAAFVDAAQLRADRCVISANQADVSGAGLFAANGASILVTNSLFTGNAAASDAGALAASTASVIDAAGCTFAANTAGRGAVLFALDADTEVSLANSILWENPAGDDSQVFLATGAHATVDRSDVQGGQDAVVLFDQDSTLTWLTNIDADPLFADPDSADYALAAGSPCIDAADNTLVPPDDLDSDMDADVSEPTPLDLAGNERFRDDIGTKDTGVGPAPVADIGAHEFQAASCYADCNQDGQLSILDFVCFQQLFQSGDPAADCNDDAELSILDFVCFQTAFAQGCG